MFHPPLRPRIAGQSRSRCFRPSTRVEREEQKESQAAACGRRPLKAVAACDSFCSSRSTRVDGRKHRDPALASSVAGEAGGTKVLTPDLFASYFTRAHDRKSSGRQLLLQCENRSTGSEEVGHREEWLVSRQALRARQSGRKDGLGFKLY